MNAIDLLVAEHNKVRKTLSEMASPTKPIAEKKKTFQGLRYDLLRHEKMEQTVWYPHFKNSEKLDNTVKQLIKEEQEAHHEIQDLNKIEAEDEWNRQFVKFKNDVEHHAQEEETKLFPQVRAILSEQELTAIGAEMQKFEEEYDAKKIAVTQ